MAYRVGPVSVTSTLLRSEPGQEFDLSPERRPASAHVPDSWPIPVPARAVPRPSSAGRPRGGGARPA
jgi:hypothetical protein